MQEKKYPGWLDLLAIIGSFLIINYVVSKFLSPAGSGGAAMLVSYVLTMGLTILFSLALTRRRTGTLRGTLRFSLRGFRPAWILWALVLMLATAVVIAPLIELFPDGWYAPIADRMAVGGWATVMAVVAAPVLEELLFRGIIQDSLVNRYGPRRGILLGAAVFGIVHGIPQQVVTAFCIGIILGTLYYKTRSLPAAMFLHAVNNALSVLMTMVKPEEKADQPLSEAMGGGMGYGVFYGICVLLIVVGIVQAVRKKNAVSR